MRCGTGRGRAGSSPSCADSLGMADFVVTYGFDLPAFSASASLASTSVM